MSIDVLEVLMKALENSKDSGNAQEIALSKTLLLLVNELKQKTILPKRAIKNLSLLENDIFFKEVIDDYKENLRNTKTIVKMYASLIKSVATGIQTNEQHKLLGMFKRNKKDVFY